MPRALELFDLLRSRERVWIQPHDFPDHDAIGCAAALQHLLGQAGIAAQIVFSGELERESLARLVSSLRIDLVRSADAGMAPDDAIVLVDTSVGRRNVTDLAGVEIAVLDHHPGDPPRGVPFVDLRPELGSTSALVYDYYRELGTAPPREIATALLVGIAMDTALLTRRVHPLDLEAFAALHPRSDVELFSEVTGNQIRLEDLDLFERAFRGLEIDGSLAVCRLEGPASREALAIVADFLLGLVEIRLVVVAAVSGSGARLTVRSGRSDWNAARIVEQFAAGRGAGGGHSDRAAGWIEPGHALESRELLTELKHWLRGAESQVVR